MTAPVPAHSFYKPATKRTFTNIQFIGKYNNKELCLPVFNKSSQFCGTKVDYIEEYLYEVMSCLELYSEPAVSNKNLVRP